MSDAADAINPSAEPHNNMASIRGRAEEISDKIQEQRMSSLETGYVAVFLSLTESANQLRYAAARGLTVPDLREVADRLDSLAEYTLDLGTAQTSGGGHA